MGGWREGCCRSPELPNNMSEGGAAVTCPFCAAKCKGTVPPSPPKFTSAPAAIKALSTARSPRCIAERQQDIGCQAERGEIFGALPEESWQFRTLGVSHATLVVFERRGRHARWQDEA